MTVADSWDTEPDVDTYYLKHPWLAGYQDEPRPFMEDQVATWFAREIKQLERLARHPPHPNLVRYYGCRVRKSRITGALLGRLPDDNLQNHAQSGKSVNGEPFLAALASAIEHLHNAVGRVHNDIQPLNIMVGPDGTPTLIDLGAAGRLSNRMV